MDAVASTGRRNACSKSIVGIRQRNTVGRVLLPRAINKSLIASRWARPCYAIMSRSLQKKAGRPRLPGASRQYINSNRRLNQALAADAA
jgi:hypothetical protein